MSRLREEERVQMSRLREEETGVSGSGGPDDRR